MPDGSLRPIGPEDDSGVGTPGVTNLILDAFAPRREAAEFQIRANVEGEKGLSGEYQMKLKDGGYLQFHNMDFGTGADGFRVEVSSENAALNNTRLELRLDNPAGKLIGSASIAGGRGKTAYSVLTGPVSAQLAAYMISAWSTR